MKIAVVGLGMEGKNAVKSLINYGHKVYASDMEKNMKLNSIDTVDIDLGHHDFDKINSADAVVLSPSLWSSKIGEKIRSSKKFLSDVLKDHKSIFTIGVTGTNGKTTTCFMIKDILEKAGLNVLVGGNAGGGFEGYTKLILETSKKKYDVLIVEVCDMTLDFCSYAFDFDMVVVTNIGRDHLNVHNSLENYRKSLCRFLEGKIAVMNEQDEILAQMDGYGSETFFFGNGHKNLKVFGKFNLQNAAAAEKVAKYLNVPASYINEALENFTPVEGRSTTLNLSGSDIIIGKTDNADAAAAVFNEFPMDIAIIGTPREHETCRFDIFKEVSKANPKIVALFPGLENTADKAFKSLKKEKYGGKIRVLDNIEDIVSFTTECTKEYKNIFIGGNGQEKIIEIQKQLQGLTKDDNVITGKKVLVIGAGNAGRPAAHLLNYLGNEVIISDVKKYQELPKKAKEKIKLLKEKGIKTEFGSHTIDNVSWADFVFVSPNIPKTAKILQYILEYKKKGQLTEITTKDIGRIINSLIKIPMMGIAGTDGKTTITNMTYHTLKEEYNTLLFSSLQDSLVIEGLVDSVVVNGEAESKDFAVFELPHGTIRMVDGIEICAGILTNLTPDHMDEFNSFEEYADRNMSIKDLLHKNGVLIVNGDDPIINQKAPNFGQEVIFYGFNEPRIITHEGKIYYPNENIELDIIAEDIELKGLYGSSFTVKIGKIPTAVCKNCGKICCSCDDFQRKYLEPCSTRIQLKVPGMCNLENAIATLATNLVLGFDLENIKNKIESFHGVNGRFEKIGTIDDVNIFIDAAHNPEGMEMLLNGLDLENKLIISIDNPDTLTVRDKFKIGTILGKYADVVIASAKNETTDEMDLEAAKTVIKGAGNIETYQTTTVADSIYKALGIAKKGDTILHIGPGVVNAYNNVKMEIENGIKAYKESK